MMNEELKEAWGGLLHPDTNISCVASRSVCMYRDTDIFAQVLV
jgi:hypothetical protein|eukprot:COSAG01_NODE_739_length_13898_cov_29.871223_13_plen_43_part_00